MKNCQTNGCAEALKITRDQTKEKKLEKRADLFVIFEEVEAENVC